MKTILIKNLLLVLMLALSTTAVAGGRNADRQIVVETAPVEHIIADVIAFTAQRAADELNKLATVDVEHRGYTQRDEYFLEQKHRAKSHKIDKHIRAELRELRFEHERTLHKLERELDRELRELSQDFAEEARDSRNRRKLAKKRDKFQRKVDKAYTKFSRKLAKANEKFDRKRAEILRYTRVSRTEYAN